MFSKDLKPRHRGPESRSDLLSFFREVTDEQLKTYTPDQVRTILAQREQCLKVAAQSSRSTKPPPGFEHLPETKLWVPDGGRECQYKVCPRCRPSAEIRSFLSLDGIVNGDIPATAALGFGFHLNEARPIIHPDRLKNIGLRPIPLRKPYERSFSSMSTLSSLYLSASDEEMIKAADANLQSSLISIGGEPATSENTGKASVATATTTDVDAQSSKSTAHDSPKENTSPTWSIAHKESIPLKASGEHANLRKCSTQMMKEEMEEGRFHKEPLEVDHGVAVSEEGVGLGVPDVITQL